MPRLTSELSSILGPMGSFLDSLPSRRATPAMTAALFRPLTGLCDVHLISISGKRIEQPWCLTLASLRVIDCLNQTIHEVLCLSILTWPESAHGIQKKRESTYECLTRAADWGFCLFGGRPRAVGTGMASGSEISSDIARSPFVWLKRNRFAGLEADCSERLRLF